MAETINIATFNLDTQLLQKNLNELQDSFFDLRKAQKEYADQTKATTKEIDLLAKENKLLSNSAGDQSVKIAENDKKMKDLVQTQKELFKSEQNLAIQMGTVKKEINQTTTQLRAYQDAEGKTNSLIDLGNAALGRQIKNKNDARAANIALNNVANQLNPNIAEEAKLLVQLNAQMDKNTNFVKQNSSETAKQKMNIGNYSSALEGVDAVLDKFGINGQQARTVVAGFTATVSKAGSDIANYSNSAIQATASTLGFKTASQQAAEIQAAQSIATKTQATANTVMTSTTNAATTATAASTLGLKAFTIALASTGIGLIVVGLGLLFAYLKNLDPLLDKIEQGFAAVGAVVRVLGSAIANLSFEGLGKSMANATKNAINLKAAQQDLADAMGIQEVRNAKASQQYDELIIKSKDRTKTEAERIAFLQEAEKIETKNYKERVLQSNEKTRLALNAAIIAGKLTVAEKNRLKEDATAYGTKLLSIGKITSAELELLKEAEMFKTNIDAESGKRLEKNINAQNKLLENSEEKKQKAIEDTKAADEKQKQRQEKLLEELLSQSKAEIDLFIANQGFKKKSLQEEYDFNNNLLKKESAYLKLQLDKKKISQIEYDAQLKTLQNNKLASDAELMIENANLELDAQTSKNQKILENDQYLSDEQLRIKQESLTAQLLAETNYQALLLEQGIINQTEYDAAIAVIKAESKVKADELIATNKAAEQEKALIDFDNEKIANEAAWAVNVQGQLDRYNYERAIEREAALKKGADMVAFDEATAAQRKAIEQSVVENKLQLASNAFGSLAAIFGEESKAGKAAAIAKATIDTYTGAQSAFTSLSGIAIVGPVLGTIAAAAAVSAGMANVKKITATKQPTFKKAAYATGVIGLRGSGSGTSDSISANLSAGESVINARSTSMFARELSAINQSGGGVGLNGSSNILNQNEIQTNVNNSQMASMIAEAVAIGSELGTSKGSQKGIIGLSENRKIMNDAKF